VGGTIAGVEETSLKALVKLEQVLPTRLRRRVNALQTYAVPVPRDDPGPRVDAESLSTIAAACRDHERLRFAYRNHDGTESRRVVDSPTATAIASSSSSSSGGIAAPAPSR
jgi:predicted DNA-binding transcriptional regulator YafY